MSQPSEIQANPATPKKLEEEEDFDDEDEEEIRKKEEEKRIRREKAMKRREEMAKQAEERKKLTPKSATASPVAPSTTSQTTVPLSPSSSASTPAKQPIREDVVASCVSFLNHPKVKQAPLSQKMAFLQKKGLTNEEIQEALTRANSTSSDNLQPNLQYQQPVSQFNQPISVQPSRQVAVPPPISQYNQPAYYSPSMYQPVNPYIQPNQLQQPILPWYASRSGLAVTAVTCVGLGVGLAVLAKRYVVQSLWNSSSAEEEKKEKELKLLEEERKSQLKVLDDLTNTLKRMQNQQDELKDMVKNVTDGPGHSKDPKDQVLNKLMLKVSELDAELKRTKAMQMDSKAFNQGNNHSWSTPSISSTSSTDRTIFSAPPQIGKPSIPSFLRDTNKSALSFQDDANSSMTAHTPTKEENSKSTADDAPRPPGALKIASMLKNGQIPDDIKEVDDTPIGTNQHIEKGSRDPPRKPWEIKSTASTSSESKSVSFEKEPRIQEIQEDDSQHKMNGTAKENGTTKENGTAKVNGDVETH